MADLPVPGSLNPDPNAKMHKLWTESQIAELETKNKRLEADAEEIIKSNLKKIEAEIIGNKRKIVALMQRADNIEKFGLDEVVEITGTTVKRLERGGQNG